MHELKKRKRRRNRFSIPLSIEQILAWADAFHANTGRMPRVLEGRISGSLGEKWANVDNALRVGCRGLPGGSSLARLLAKHRGVRNPQDLPPYTEEQILAWADEHKTRTRKWPQSSHGSIGLAPEETWMAVDAALWSGRRGLPGGSSLARLLQARASERGRSQRSLWSAK